MTVKGAAAQSYSDATPHETIAPPPPSAVADARRPPGRRRKDRRRAAQPAASSAPLSAAPATAAADHSPTPGNDWRSLRNTWPVFVSGLPALLTLLALTFSLFPWLEPVPPPEVRSVTVSELFLGERDRDLGDGRVTNIVYFGVESVGYDAENIAVDWLVIDAATRQRLREQPTPERWGVIDIGTRSDRVVGEIDVAPPFDHVGCVFVRVLLSPQVKGGGTPAAGLLLDVADTAPFDPYDAANPDCPSIEAPPGSTA